MSSFLCSDLHIAVIAAFDSLESNRDPLKTARTLRRLNNAAQRENYGESPVPFGAMTGTRPMTIDKRAGLALAAGIRRLAERDSRVLRAAYVAQLCACLKYQCDEAPEKHSARATLTRIDALAREIAGPAVAIYKTVWSI